MRALLTGDEAVGALLEWVLGVCGALPVLLQSLLGLGKVATLSVAVVKVAPILEGVVVEVAVLSTAVVKVTILEDCHVQSIEG